jgi:hypothetical protein
LEEKRLIGVKKNLFFKKIGLVSFSANYKTS